MAFVPIARRRRTARGLTTGATLVVIGVLLASCSEPGRTTTTEPSDTTAMSGSPEPSSATSTTSTGSTTTTGTCAPMVIPSLPSVDASGLPESIVANLAEFQVMVEAACGLPLIVPIDLPEAYTWSWEPLDWMNPSIYTYNAEARSNSTPDNYPMTFDVIRSSAPPQEPESSSYSLEPHLDPVGESPVYRLSSEADEVFWFETGNVWRDPVARQRLR